jgi:hypothetical protein
MVELAVALGPEMPGWGTWEWVGLDVAGELKKYFRVSTFSAWGRPEADVVVVVKHAPPLEWMDAMRGRVVYAPVDYYQSPGDIDRDGAMLRRCACVVVHCERLRRYFEPYARVCYLDHHVKYGVRPVGDSEATKQKNLGEKNRGVDFSVGDFSASGPILWTGVRTNIPALAEWVNRHPLPGELIVLTTPEDPGRVPRAGEYGFRDEARVRIVVWRPEEQTAVMAGARAALDIKGEDFASRHKPATKAVDFIAAGLPLAMNPGTAAGEWLAGMGFDVVSPLDTERWLSREYWEETRRFGAVLRELLSLERVGRRWRNVILSVVRAEIADFRLQIAD